MLVADRHQFLKRYGLGIAVHGSYSGQLDNAGETLNLYAPDGRWISGVRYDPQPPWPVGADGEGYSLVLAYPQLGSGTPLAWRLSTTTSGTPGSSDSLQFTGSTELDSDADGLSDLAEYILATLPDDAKSGASSLDVRWDDLGRFTLSFPRRLGVDDYELSVAWSEDLTHWSPAALLRTLAIGPGVARETWGVNPGNASRLFLRLILQPTP